MCKLIHITNINCFQDNISIHNAVVINLIIKTIKNVARLFFFNIVLLYRKTTFTLCFLQVYQISCVLMVCFIVQVSYSILSELHWKRSYWFEILLKIFTTKVKSDSVWILTNSLWIFRFNFSSCNIWHIFRYGIILRLHFSQTAPDQFFVIYYFQVCFPLSCH